MPFNFIKYFLLLITLVLGLNVKAQEDSTFQKYLDSNISTKSLQNNDLVFVKKVLSNQRMVLQSKYDKRLEADHYTDIKKQVRLLEKAIIHYVSMNHKVIVNEMDMQKTNVDSELLLARLVYIKSKTWCMEESLQQSMNSVYRKSLEKQATNNSIIEMVNLTKEVIMSIEKSKQFDRLKYKYNQKVVIENWEYTASRLKDYDARTSKFDRDYKILYKAMLVDLYTLIGILAMF